jgi:hypothetical protein
MMIKGVQEKFTDEPGRVMWIEVVMCRKGIGGRGGYDVVRDFPDQILL